MRVARKYSRKREAMLELLRSTTEHPGAEWIYARLKPQFPDLSLGTVYRNLALFRDDGEIISVGTVAGHERFDADTSDHAHFICNACSRVLDAGSPCPADILAIERELGVTVTGHQLTYFGLCSNCIDSTDGTLADGE